jgi:hypothetical protein
MNDLVHNNAFNQTGDNAGLILAKAFSRAGDASRWD